MTEGFYPKASALYKKLLKLTPDDEDAQLNLAEISQKQGLLADAKAQLNAIETRRRGRGDRAGAAEIVVKRGAIDPADFDARITGARTLAEMGRTEEAAAWFRSIHDDLLEKVTVRRLRGQIAAAGLEIVREELHVTGTVRRMPAPLGRFLGSSPLTQNALISNMEYVLMPA